MHIIIETVLKEKIRGYIVFSCKNIIYSLQNISLFLILFFERKGQQRGQKKGENVPFAFLKGFTIFVRASTFVSHSKRRKQKLIQFRACMQCRYYYKIYLFCSNMYSVFIHGYKQLQELPFFPHSLIKYSNICRTILFIRFFIKFSPLNVLFLLFNVFSKVYQIET